MLKELENITGMSDVMFKAIMYTNKNILSKLLEEILDIKIENINYLNSEIPLKKFLEKGKRLDLYIETTDTYVDVEVSIKPSKYIINRNLSYAFLMYCQTIEKGNSYDQYKNVHLISLIANKKNKLPIRIIKFKDQEGVVVSEKLLCSEIYIDNFIKMYYNKDVNKINKYKYLIMLGLNRKQLIEFNKEYGDDIVNEYVEEFNKVIEIKEFKPLFSKEEDERRIRNSEKLEGYEQGIEQGQQERNVEIAKNMLKEDADINFISKVTGLSIGQISELN